MKIETEPIMNNADASGPVSPAESTSASSIVADEVTNGETLRERVVLLERKVDEQKDEIAVLRSTLSDVLRRLNQLEGNKAATNKFSAPFRNDRYSHSAADRRKGAPYSNSPTQRRGSHHLSPDVAHSVNNNRSPATSPAPTQSISRRSSPAQPSNLTRRWNSSSDFHQSQFTTPSGTVMRNKDFAYNADDGCLKLFLRGRPINLYAPTSLQVNLDVSRPAQPPSQKLHLEWAYGYRGRDCRNNLVLLPTGEMVYFVAAVVVLYNVEDHMQRHYLGHTDDVKCLALHPNKLIVATGQVAGVGSPEKRPHIRIWNSVSLHTLQVVGIGDFDRAICCISFSKADGGSLLCAVDEAVDHNISVWEWQKGSGGHKLTDTKCSTETVLGVEFHPIDTHVIVTYGRGHINFWTVQDSRALVKRSGIFENRDKPKYVTCLAFSDMGDVITGDSNGTISVWPRGQNTISRSMKAAHCGAVFSLFVDKYGNLVSGGKDSRLVEWDRSFKQTGRVLQVPEEYGAPRVVSQGKGLQLLIGTTRNCILRGSMELSCELVVRGHTEELWALTCHPMQHQFLTAGHDRLLHLWDTMAHSVVWSLGVSSPAQSACFSSDGNFVAVGLVTGAWLILDVHTREVVYKNCDGNEPIQVIRFSPDMKYLALGSRDNHIYVYQINEGLKKLNRVGRCSGHSSFVLHLDWSADSCYLQSNSGDYELLFWTVATCRQVTHTTQMRDVAWSSQTCTLGFTCAGIWPDGADGTDVNVCRRSNSGSLMATGDDWGQVKLFTHPTPHPKSLSHTYRGHSSHVTGVEFLHDDSRLITIGGGDTSILQWMVQ